MNKTMLRLAVMALAGALAFTGCSATQSAPSPSVSIAPMWKQYIDQALADPNLSDFQRQVLSDYQITDAEYQEARDRLRQCLAAKGWISSDAPGGGSNIVGAPGTANEGKAVPNDVFLTCEDATTSYIEPIYLGMRDSPQGLTRAQMIRACYEAHDVPDGAGMSDDQFAQMVSANGYHASTPQGVLCYWDPDGSQGMTVEQAEEQDQQRDTVSSSQMCSPGPDGSYVCTQTAPS